MSINDWKKERAIFEQKNELLALQVQELKEREENYKKFNDTILNAYNSLQSDSSKQNSKVYKEIQLTLEQYSKELIEAKNKGSAALIQLENENRELKNTISVMETKQTQLNMKYQGEIQELEQRIELGDTGALRRALEQKENEITRLKNEQQQQAQQLIKAFEQEKSDLLLRYNDQSISDRYSFVEERHSAIDKKQLVEENKENLNQQLGYTSFKSNSSSETPQNIQTGCIVSIKGKQSRSKTQLTTKNSMKPQDPPKKSELSISNVLNCKNSNVMEINTHNLDFFRGLETQSSPNNSLSGLLHQIQKRNFAEQSDSSSPMQASTKLSMAQQIQILTKDLQKAKSDPDREQMNSREQTRDQMNASQLKHEIKHMINKLLKAKGRMTESIVGRPEDRLSARRSLYERNGDQSRSFESRSTNKSLAEFSRQINAVKSIENFQQVLKSKVNSYKNF